MGDELVVSTPGANPSHLVLYPLPNINYTVTPMLNIDTLMQHICNSKTLNYNVADFVADAERYKSGAADRQATQLVLPPAAVASMTAPAGHSSPKKTLAGAAAASEAAAAVFGELTPAAGASQAGLTLPLAAASDPAAHQQQQLGGQQRLVLFLRRKLLPLRVAARRIAAAEAWAQHVSEQQQKRQQAAGDAVGSTDEDANLLQSLVEDAGESGAAAQQQQQQQKAAAGSSASQGAGTAMDEDQELLKGLQGGDGTAGTASASNKAQHTPNGLSGAEQGQAQQQQPERGLEAVLEQLQPRIKARAEQLLLRQPLALTDLLAAFQADNFAAAQQLNLQVCECVFVSVGEYSAQTCKQQSALQEQAFKQECVLADMRSQLARRDPSRNSSCLAQTSKPPSLVEKQHWRLHMLCWVALGHAWQWLLDFACALMQ